MDLNNRRVKVFRCHFDPVIPGMQAKRAFDLKAIPGAEAKLIQDAGVWFRLPIRTSNATTEYQEHLIPYSNLEAIRLELPEPVATRKKE